jgi:glycerophosphoryl diester phosphodiesterase
VQQRLPSLLNPPLAFGHRGARSLAPDNTLSSFELALKLGANGLETDAWLSADGVVILDHDGVVRRMGRNRPLSTLDVDKRASHMPTLIDFFDTCGVSFDLSIDVKDAAAFSAIVETADKHGFDRQRLWLCHHKVEILVEERTRFEDVRFVDSSRLSRIKEGAERRLAFLADHGIDVLNMHHTDWNGGLVTMAHKFGVLAFGWDAQFNHVLENGYRMGLDGMYSDYIDRLVDVYDQQIGHVPRR